MKGRKAYREFLKSKAITIPACGLKTIPDLNPAMMPFQRDITRYALKLGRAALFEDCGMGKTFQQLEWGRVVYEEVEDVTSVLVLAPLQVAEQTHDEGRKFGISTTLCESGDDVRAGINLTNYEKLHKFNASQFQAIVLDESSILKAFDGKTRRAITEFAKNMQFRLACTATPAPNDYVELGNHAEFLGVMTMQEMLGTFFVHDGGETSKWRLKGHAEDDFWRWVATWAVMLRKPSDLGYSDDGFILPKLRIHQLTVASEALEGMLFPTEAKTLVDRRSARRNSLDARVQQCASVVNASQEQFIVWCNLNAEAEAVSAAIPGAVEISGSGPNSSDNHRRSTFADFIAGRLRVLVTKPEIAGIGLNLQNCHQEAFLGLSDSWEQWYQAVRRCWRFGQKEPVDCYVITSQAEGAVVRNIERKEKQATEMAEGIVKHMAHINRENIQGTKRDTSDYKESAREGDRWKCHLGDAVEVIGRSLDHSVDYVIYSPPFASLYCYSNSDRDMGNSRNYDEFRKHYQFLVSHLFRVLKPGRLLSFHCMNLPTSKAFHGYIGIQDFRGDLIRMHQEAGFIFHSEVCIWKDPVISMQRTKALGLLYKQLRKDSVMSRQGIPDYLVTMRKPGENLEPVAKTHDGFPVDRWQRYASPVWMDINPSKTLQHRSARDEKDERHICPLQLEVIERAIELWTNPGELVLSPFGGIGSEGFVAVKMGRRAVLVELKGSYWKQACKNLAIAEKEKTHEQDGLFAAETPAAVYDDQSFDRDGEESVETV